MSTKQLNDKVYELNSTWSDFTKTNDIATNLEIKGQFVDPLLIEQLQKMNHAMDKQQSELNSIRAAMSRPNLDQNTGMPSSGSDMEYKKAFCSYLRRGGESQMAQLETKGLSGDAGNEFGYSVTTRMSEHIATSLAVISPLRKMSSVIEISTDVLELIEDRHGISAAWSQQGIDNLDRDNAISPTKRGIRVHELYAQPKVTQRLLDDPRVDMEEWLSSRLTEVFARTENDAFINGDGIGKPMGILSYKEGTTWGQVEQIKTADATGITTSSLLQLFFSLKEHYAVNAKFLMNRSAVAMVRSLKNENGRYMWQPTIDSKTPNMLLGLEVVESPDMPIAKEGNIAIALADFSKAYQIIDRAGIRLLRDPYTGKPYVKYYAVKLVGGDVVNFDAIKLLKISA